MRVAVFAWFPLLSIKVSTVMPAQALA
jgi:hypothetical protein